MHHLSLSLSLSVSSRLPANLPYCLPSSLSTCACASLSQMANDLRSNCHGGHTLARPRLTCAAARVLICETPTQAPAPQSIDAKYAPTAAALASGHIATPPIVAFNPCTPSAKRGAEQQETRDDDLDSPHDARHEGGIEGERAAALWQADSHATAPCGIGTGAAKSATRSGSQPPSSGVQLPRMSSNTSACVRVYVSAWQNRHAKLLYDFIRWSR